GTLASARALLLLTHLRPFGLLVGLTGLRRITLRGLAGVRPTGLPVQAPEVRQALERRIALHRFEGLHGVILVTALELRDTGCHPSIGLVLRVSLAESFRELIGRLVVLSVTEVCPAHCEVLVARSGGIGFLLELRESRLVRSGALLGTLEQPLGAVLAALVG